MLAKAATGRKATGSYPYGYRGEGKGRERDAAPDPDEQATICTIMELREMGCSYREIVTALNRGGHEPKWATHWSPMTVRRIYERELKKMTPPPADTQRAPNDNHRLVAMPVNRPIRRHRVLGGVINEYHPAA